MYQSKAQKKTENNKKKLSSCIYTKIPYDISEQGMYILRTMYEERLCIVCPKLDDIY